MNLGSIQLPINAATKTFAILAKRGAGKTYTGGVMAEEFYKNNIPFVAIDPIDVWWGLRLLADGKSKGLPVVVFGREHADIQLDRDMGRRIAQAIVKKNISCIISTFGLPKKAQRFLIAEFAEELLNINNTPRHIFIEEAHEFVPQRVFGEMGKTFNAVSNLVVMGRNRSLGVTMLNQRAATINKDVLTQIDTLIAMRSVGPQDRKALIEWVEQHAAEGDFEKFLVSLPSLPTGEAWIWSPEFLGIFKQIKIRKRETFHPDREKIGGKFQVPALESTDIESFIADFAKQTEKPKPADDATKRTTVPKEVPTYPAPDKSEIIALRNEYESKLIAKDSEIRGLQSEIRRLQMIIGNVQKIVGGGISISTELITRTANNDNVLLWQSKLGNGGAGRMFKFLAEHPGQKYSRTQLGLATGLKSTTGSFSTYMSTLKSNKLIIEQEGMSQINPEL